jgi:formamidopyrimidine-DNA glycosylase
MDGACAAKRQRVPENVNVPPEMAVGQAATGDSTACGGPGQRIVYAENECNYCARGQTGGKILADRSLSRLLKASWPRSIDELG